MALRIDRATFSGVTMRMKGLAVKPSVMRVLTKMGQTQLTPMFSDRSSQRSEELNPTMPCLEAA